MSEDEKENIIFFLKSEIATGDLLYSTGSDIFYFKDMLQKTLNLIEKQQKELEKKNKVIDLMAKMINSHDIDDDICGQFGKDKDCSDFTDEELCVDCIKEYFYKKVEEKNE